MALGEEICLMVVLGCSIYSLYYACRKEQSEEQSEERSKVPLLNEIDRA